LAVSRVQLFDRTGQLFRSLADGVLEGFEGLANIGAGAEEPLRRLALLEL
jgi:hypothetical protein